MYQMVSLTPIFFENRLCVILLGLCVRKVARIPNLPTHWAEQPFLFQLLSFYRKRQTQRERIDPKRLRHTHRYQHKEQVTQRRFFRAIDLKMS